MAARPAGRVSPGWIAVLLGITALWGYNWVVLKKALAYTGPFQFAAWRFLLGSAILFLVIAVTRRPLRVRPVSKVIWVGLLQSAGNTGLNMWVLLMGPVGRAALLSYAMPFWVLLVSWPLLRERPTRLQWIATGIAMAGIGLMVFEGASSHAGGAAVLAVLSGISWAGGTIMSRQLLVREKCDVLALTTWQMLVGGVAMEAAALLVPGRPTSFTPAFLLLLAYEVLPATALAWLLWVHLLGKVEASVASLAILATPVIGLGCSMLEMGERPGRTEALGMALMVVALVLVGPLALRQARAGRPAAKAA
jgi:drug/metabolite transporter (DMT)-like permease